ncbi:CWC16 protein [Sphaerosporella brunnea]|uniref:Splicing factor YJU2 n=1 Tax=Sphaerosporella brunnea TaxID=1250544 RepID=A0A5J5EWA3_9PEZI|nr:CWC16 protein [Sphaerosporella brunnea]
MSERKVLQKYYPPDFDPSKITRSKGPKPAGPKQQTVRLMAPFSMKCLNCGEFIYKGRKFNARKENSQEKYYDISIFRFYIRCTRCSSEITFKTDPKNMDYTCEKGAIRNFEPWRIAKEEEETEEERLNRLEEEENESAMEKLETKTLDSKREMQIADALDDIRTRNARNERVDEEEIMGKLAEVKDAATLERERQEKEDEEAARKAFRTEDDTFVRRVVDEEDAPKAAATPAAETGGPATAKIPSFKKTVKRKRDLGAALGIKKKKTLV